MRQERLPILFRGLAEEEAWVTCSVVGKTTSRRVPVPRRFVRQSSIVRPKIGSKNSSRRFPPSM